MRKEYQELCEMVGYMSREMTNTFVYEDIGKDPPFKKQAYFLAWEAFKTIDFIHVGLLEVFAISQCMSLFRQLYETVAIAKILFLHPKILESYNDFHFFRLTIADKPSEEKIRLIYEKYKDLGAPNNPSALKFLDYSWANSLIDTSKFKGCVGIDAITELADFKDFSVWRDTCNKFIHVGITAADFKELEYLEHLYNELAYMIAVMFQELATVYHNDNGFDFNFAELKYEEFTTLYLKITNTRKKETKN